MSSLSELVTDLRNEMKMDFYDKIWSVSVKKKAVKKGYFQVQKDANFGWPENQDSTATITLVQSTQEYSLPARTIHLYKDGVKLASNSQILTKTTKEQVFATGSTSEGTPSEYYVFGTKLGVNPIPSAAGTLNLLRKKRLADLSDSQDSEFPEDFDEAIVCYAAYDLWKQSKNRDMANSKYQDYQQALNTLLMTYIYQDASDLTFGYQRMSARLPIKREA